MNIQEIDTTRKYLILMGLHETYNFKFCAKTVCKNATKARYDYAIKILIWNNKN